MSIVAALTGWSLQTFSVPIVLAVTWTLTAPHMLLIALFASVMAVFSQVLPSVIYVIATANSDAAAATSSNTGSNSGSQTALNALYLLLLFLSQEGFRCLICYALLSAELQFRQRGQSLSGSKLGTAFTGLAAGAGFGTMLAVYSVGTSINLATLASYNSVVAYDFHKCPQMPLLQLQSLNGLFIILCNMAWTVIVLQCVSAIVVRRRQRQQLADGPPPNEAAGNDNIAPRASMLASRRQGINSEGPSHGAATLEGEGRADEQLTSMKQLREKEGDNKKSSADEEPAANQTGSSAQTKSINQQEKKEAEDNNQPLLPPKKKKVKTASLPLPPINYARVTISDLSGGQAKLFFSCVLVLHFVFKAVSLVMYRNISTDYYGGASQNTGFVESYYTSASYRSLLASSGISSSPPQYMYDGSFYDGSGDLSYSGGCTAVLAVQSVISVFAIALASIVAWNDRR